MGLINFVHMPSHPLGREMYPGGQAVQAVAAPAGVEVLVVYWGKSGPGSSFAKKPAGQKVHLCNVWGNTQYRSCIYTQCLGG